MITNILTVDVEDYYMVSAFSRQVPRDAWPSYESRVVRNTEKVLGLFEAFDVKATFFMLGWVARRFPGLVRKIRAGGHEIGCHSFDHREIHQLSPAQFREDTGKAKKTLEDILGEEVLGYRAPSFSITSDTLWALEILAEEGFRYDSSIYPIRHDRYGIPSFDRFPVLMDVGGRRLLEVPPSTVRVRNVNIPIAGGGYFRLYPLWVTTWGIRHLNRAEGKPSVVYFHPWELDPDQPRIRSDFIGRTRHYVNIERTEKKLRELLTVFAFSPIRDAFADQLADGESRAAPAHIR